MTKSCLRLVCVVVEESGREGFLEEVGAEGGGEGILGWRGAGPRTEAEMW